MTPEVFAEWLQRQGHKIVRTTNSYWCDLGLRTWQAFPYHWLVEAQPGELSALWNRERAIGIRYSTPLTANDGMMSYHVVLERRDYSVDRLSKKARYDVRKAAKLGAVEPIPLARFAGEGWELRYETLVRQGRKGAESAARWKSLCASAADLPGFETWGVIVNGELAASLLAFTCDTCCSILYQQSRTSYLSQGVNNLLTFAFTEILVQRQTIDTIFYGLHSLDAPSSVDEFKFRMGYTARPVRQRVVFHPWLAPLFNPASHAALRQLHRWRPDNPTLAKTEGMLRFFLEGKRPLDQQCWPDELAKTAATDADS